MRFFLLLFSLFAVSIGVAHAQDTKLYNSKGYGGTGKLYMGGNNYTGGGTPLSLKQILEGRSEDTSYRSSSQTSAYRPYGTGYKGSSVVLSPQQVSQYRYRRDQAAQQREAEAMKALTTPTYSKDLKESYLNKFQGNGSANASTVGTQQSQKRMVYKGRSEVLAIEKPKRVFNSPY